MGQPIKIYKGKVESVVYGKAQLADMEQKGWSLAKPSTRKPPPKPPGK